MKTVTFLLFLTTALVISSCSESSDSESNITEMIIGVSFGECIGDCATMFQFREDMVFADVVENLFSGDLEFSNEALMLEENLIQDFKNLETLVPVTLINNDAVSYGCPDCGDWGAIFFSLNDRVWTLDNAVENNPEEIQPFVSEIQSLIQVLSN